MSSERSIVVVNPARPGQISLAEGLGSFIAALHPLGAIAKTIGEIMACRVEIKRIQQESERLRGEYEIENRKIDATLKIALQSLEDRRKAMERFFRYAERQLDQHHIYGNQIVRTIQNMNKLIMERNVSSDEKQLAHETIRALSKELVASHEAGAKSLAVLVQATRQDLLAVPSLKGLLPPGT